MFDSGTQDPAMMTWGQIEGELLVIEFLYANFSTCPPERLSRYTALMRAQLRLPTPRQYTLGARV